VEGSKEARQQENVDLLHKLSVSEAESAFVRDSSQNTRRALHCHGDVANKLYAGKCSRLASIFR